MIPKEDLALGLGATLAVLAYLAGAKPEYATVILAISAVLKALIPGDGKSQPAS